VKVRVLSWAPFLVPSPHTPPVRIRRRHDNPTGCRGPDCCMIGTMELQSIRRDAGASMLPRFVAQ
jgi:hypothetical protein